MKKILSALLFLACAAPVVNAQSTAVRFILGEGHKVYAKPAFGNYCMGLGVDRSFNDKLTAGLDVAFDVAAALKDGGTSVQSLPDGISAYVSPHLMSVNYHTEYALGDDDGTHAYIGTFIGLRRIKQDWVLYDSRNYEYKESRFTATKMLIPLGLRFGLRGTTDGGFMDLYVAAGYQVGGGKSTTANSMLKDAPYTETTALALTLGWAYGFGW